MKNGNSLESKLAALPAGSAYENLVHATATYS